MKKAFFSLILAIMSAAFVYAEEKGAVLLTIDGQPVYASEFLYIYNKNNNETTLENKTIDEYLDMFINYKLKVFEAKQQGLDTTSAFKKELSGYRAQIVPPYLTDTVKENELVLDAYNRMKEDIAVSQIVVRCPMNSNAEDSAIAYKKIQEARQRVTTGIERRKGKKIIKAVPEDFAAVAREISEEPEAAQTSGYVGWVTPFRYVLSFENAAYNTAEGKVSEIFRTPYGFHILKVEKRIPHHEVRVAHIMCVTPKGEDKAKNDSVERVAKLKIDSIYADVTHGAAFAKVAFAMSNDRGSAANGGDIGWIGRGATIPEFEEVAFALKDSGEISKPVKSQYGWHVIMKLGDRDVQPFAEMEKAIRRRVTHEQRSRQIEASFVGKLKTKYNFKENTTNLLVFYDVLSKCQISDSLFAEVTSQMNGVLFTFADQQRTQADFAAYLIANPKSNYTIADKIIDEKFQSFVNVELIEYEKNHLEDWYPEFRNLMTEYHDGILLFDLSLSRVWDKASQDTVGLQNYFKANKKKYTFDAPRYKGRVVYCKDASTMKAAKAIIKNANKDSINSYLIHRLNTDSVENVRFEKGLWEKGQNPAVDKYGFRLKDAKYVVGEQFPYVFTAGKVIKAPEEYSDVRGAITTDYQNYLEQEWIKELRAKHKVEVDNAVFESLKAEQK